jgi:ATP-dependent exoDNAse (exonuclease V) alpha subunit
LDTTKPLSLDHDYAKTTFSSQGLTAENVIYHAQSTSTNLMNQRDFYVATSRATDSIQVVTNNKRELTDLVKQSSGEKETALTSNKDTNQSHESSKNRDKNQGIER